MQVDVAPPAMVRSEMKDQVDSLHCLRGHAGVEQVAGNQLDRTGTELMLDVLSLSTREVIDHTHPRDSSHQCIH